MTDISPIIVALAAFVFTGVSGYFILPVLRKLNFGQTILEEGPAWHKKKQGTPTMGGIVIIFGTLLAFCLGYIYSVIAKKGLYFELGENLLIVIASLALAVAMGAVGFIDDYIKVVKKRNLGLTARQKTIFQLIISAAYLIVLSLCGVNTTWIPFVGEVDVTSGFGLVFWVIALFFIYGFINAVNLTDGVDGLAGSVTLVVACGFMLMSGLLGVASTNVGAAALAGACVGFLIWNAHPAKMFMGDTGSLFLGGMVVGLSFSIGKPILLLLMGVVYLCEALSVMIQVAYFKKTKKRIFKMTPIHHHFEMSGWSEEKVVYVFAGVTFLFSAIAILLAYFA